MASGLENIETIESPFRRFVTTIGVFPTAFTDAMTYYECLAYLVKYLEETVIPAVNENAEALEELQTLYIQLKAFVDNYFDNLDVQEEINNKLDEMVEDGTFGNIVTPILEQFEAEISDDINTIKNNIGTMSDLQTANKSSLVNAVNSANNNYITLLRRKYGNNYRLFTDLHNVSFFNNVLIYKDIYSNSFTYYFNPNSFKQAGTNSWYVNPATTESGSNQTGAIDHPFNNIVKAVNACSSGDNIILRGGIYPRSSTNLGSNVYLSKSVNLINYEGEKVYLTNADKLSWTQHETYTNVYSATRSNVACGIDMRNKDEDSFAKLTMVDSIEACNNTLNSYFTSGSTVYANIGEEVTNEKVIFPLNINSAMIKVQPSDANVNLYIENLTCIGGDYGIFTFTGTSTYKTTVVANNCNFYYSFYTSSAEENAITVRGADTIFYKCKACYGYRDGFNYHKNGSALCNSIEIDCVGSNNGLDSSDNNNNGSTTHDGNKILRINGTYFNNKGGNVTDVQSDTVSININCSAFDSKSSGTTSNGDFVAQQAGVVMDCYNCYAKGSNSYVNFYCVEDATLNMHNCLYDTVTNNGSGTID